MGETDVEPFIELEKIQKLSIREGLVNEERLLMFPALTGLMHLDISDTWLYDEQSRALALEVSHLMLVFY